MAGLSNAWENKTLDALFGAARATTYTTLAPASIYLALVTTVAASINDDGATGTGEVTGGGYARVLLDNDGLDAAGAWKTATGGQKKNGIEIPFPAATGNWLIANTWMLLSDNAAIATTNVICWGAITTPQTLTAGQTARFVIDALVISAD